MLFRSDEQEEMLQLFTVNAADRGMTSETFLGQWPDIADRVPTADVVTVHHVAFNVGNIVPFLKALDAHARKRVIIEVPVVHPMSNMNEGWKHFWNVTRPTVPVAADLVEVLKEIGINATIEYFESEILLDKKVPDANKYIRRRLCLGEDRQDEVDAFLAAHPIPERRKLCGPLARLGISRDERPCQRRHQMVFLSGVHGRHRGPVARTCAGPATGGV